jgi:hypothetical protein
VAKAARLGLSGAMVLALGMAAQAQGLDPRVAGPLMQLIQAAQMQCQSGNQQACVTAQQFQQGGNEMAQAQFACQQGNPQACQFFQTRAQQVLAAHQQFFGGGQPAPGYTPPYNQQQQAWDHQQRMQQQQWQFQQQQQQYQQQQRANDLQHQRFMDQLRR